MNQWYYERTMITIILKKCEKVYAERPTDVFYYMYMYVYRNDFKCILNSFLSLSLHYLKNSSTKNSGIKRHWVPSRGPGLFRKSAGKSTITILPTADANNVPLKPFHLQRNLNLISITRQLKYSLLHFQQRKPLLYKQWWAVFHTTLSSKCLVNCDSRKSYLTPHFYDWIPSAIATILGILNSIT